ncbi:MAG: hypothetical protein LBJ00_00410 [Planctomycetaceae bacterium]|nr:hypothetical protein [Planctomycetaceae bacterium]
MLRIGDNQTYFPRPVRDEMLVENMVYSSCFEIPEAGHASVAPRSGCSWAKPTAHTGFGIKTYFVSNRDTM